MFDPLKARQITLDFTNYLRKNFNAIAGDSSIPFSAELEHTRAYLAVEQAMMCGGSLSIASRAGGGTVVTVTVPDSAAQ